MIKIDPAWEEESPGPIPAEVRHEFMQLIVRIAAKGNRKGIYEHFKKHFAAAAGTTSGRSSTEDYAAFDLETDMAAAAENAPLFIKAFVEGCEELRAKTDLPIPTLDRINRILEKHDSGYRIKGDVLVAARAREPVSVPQKTPSLDEEADEVIQTAIAASQTALDKGHGRQAVAELLWVLESVATAFDGTETPAGAIKGKYFNTIVKEMQARTLSVHQKQILNSMTALHGYLSSPQGGGIRHGQDLKKGTPLSPNDARLYCDLIRSYIAYMLDEHNRLKQS